MCFHPPSDIISPKMIIFCGFELEKSNWVKRQISNFGPKISEFYENFRFLSKLIVFGIKIEFYISLRVFMII